MKTETPHTIILQKQMLKAEDQISVEIIKKINTENLKPER